MKRLFLIITMASLFIGSTVLVGMAASEHEAHHPAGAQPAKTSATGMGMEQMPCMSEPGSGSMMGMMGEDMMGGSMANMMGAGKMVMMEHRMEHMFYLDRVEELKLSAEQVGKLKELHTECRKDNIRNAAEAKIARLDLASLLSESNWSLKNAESLVRKTQKLEGDIQVRHLQALSDARKVLSEEQLKLAKAGAASDNLDNLFQ